MPRVDGNQRRSASHERGSLFSAPVDSLTCSMKTVREMSLPVEHSLEFMPAQMRRGAFEAPAGTDADLRGASLALKMDDGENGAA